MNQGPTLQNGASNNDVKRLQRLLVMLKILVASDIDGIFGPKTEQAVRDFQVSEGLNEDGIVGPITWSALPGDPGTATIRRGSTGEVVKSLQEGLLRFGGSGSPTDPGPIDGIFGPRTEGALRAYQTQIGVPVDGLVGDLTWWSPAGGAGATLASLSQLTTI
jgi:peptidoglycan hydrolase-like protein with peptidoglycan-binding domain